MGSQLRNEAENGFTCVAADAIAFQGFELRNCSRGPLGQLHGERTTSMVSTFQLTRTIRLRLTHQMMRNVGVGRFVCLHEDTLYLTESPSC